MRQFQGYGNEPEKGSVIMSPNLALVADCGVSYIEVYGNAPETGLRAD